MEKRIEALEESVRALVERLDRLEGRSIKPKVEHLPPIPSEPRAPLMSMGKFLAVVSVICFVLAGSFIVKLAIETGWLTPARQWLLTVSLGAALCGVGRYFEKINRDYRSYLSAAGIIVLYIASYSSSLYFNIVSQDVSLILGVVVSAIGLTLFNYHRSEVFSITSVVGTYFSLFLFDRSLGLVMSSSFFILWAAVFSWFSTHFKSRTVSLVASYHGIGLCALINQSVIDASDLKFVILVLAIQFLIFAYGVYQYSFKNNEKLSDKESWSYFPVLCFFYGVSYYFINILIPGLAPWIGLGFAVGLLLGYESIKKKIASADPLASRQMIYAFLAIVIFQAGYLELLPSAAKSWLLPLLIVISYVASKREDFPKTSKAFRIMGIAIGFIEFFSLCGKLLNNASDWNGVFVALATIGLGTMYYLNMGRMIQNHVGAFLSGLHILALLALYRIAQPYGSLVVSLAWATYAITILTLGFKKKDKILAKSSLLVLSAASLKALLYDAGNAPTMVRIFCLLLTGLLLYGTGLLFQKMQAWQEKQV